MVVVGEDLWVSPSPTPLQQLPAAVAQESIQVGFGYLQRRKVHSLCVQPAPELCQHASRCFSHVQAELLCSSLFPLPLVLPLGTTKKSPAPSAWLSPFRYRSALIRSPLSLLFPS